MAMTRDKTELRQEQVTFLQTIHAFVEDPAIKNIRDERQKKIISEIMKALEKVQTGMLQGSMYYALPEKDEEHLAEFFRSKGDVRQLVHQLGAEQKRMSVDQWDKTTVEARVRERVGNSMFLVRDLCEKLMKKESTPETVRLQIANTLQDIAWRDPGDAAVTTENVSQLLTKAHIPEHRKQDAFWTNFQQDLETAIAATEEKTELRPLLEAITDAADRNGLFAAIGTLFKKKK